MFVTLNYIQTQTVPTPLLSNSIYAMTYLLTNREVDKEELKSNEFVKTNSSSIAN